MSGKELSMTRSSEPRSRLLEAFNHLMLDRTQGRPALGEVIDKAQVARSTLYDHFGGRDDLLLEAIKIPLKALANVGAGDGDEKALIAMLEHFRSRRQDALDLISGPLHNRINRNVAAMICERDKRLDEKSAIHIADLLFGFIRLWLAGETAYRAERLAVLMINSADAQRKILLPQAR
jgi:AcrR family transcriptional regulator